MDITLEEIQKLMDDYGNIRYLLEDLKATRDSAVQSILSKYPQVAQEIEDIEAEVSQKIEQAEQIEKLKKKTLQAHIDEYVKTIPLKDKGKVKSKLLTVSLDRKITYDPVALDGMATENPKLLAFRNETVSTRITLNKL
jgi:DNA-binding protein H-NS